LTLGKLQSSGNACLTSFARTSTPCGESISSIFPMGACGIRCPAPGQTRQAGKRMKAIILATATAIILLVVVTIAFRFYQTAQRARQMTLIYLGCVILSALIWFATPVDLGFLAPSLLIEPGWLDFSLMVFFFSAAFFGGALQLYNLADRGFSLRILIDVEETNSDVVDADWLVANYAGGRGLTWMYGKRIEGLLETKLVDRKAEMIELTSKGERAAAVLLAVRRFLRLEPQS